LHTIVLRKQHSHIADALSGRRLDALVQCVAIEVAGGGEGLASTVNCYSLAPRLCAMLDALRQYGTTLTILVLDGNSAPPVKAPGRSARRSRSHLGVGNVCLVRSPVSSHSRPRPPLLLARAHAVFEN